MAAGGTGYLVQRVVVVELRLRGTRSVAKCRLNNSNSAAFGHRSSTLDSLEAVVVELAGGSFLHRNQVISVLLRKVRATFL